jgi:hypothetical protein
MATMTMRKSGDDAKKRDGEREREREKEREGKRKKRLREVMGRDYLVKRSRQLLLCSA